MKVTMATETVDPRQTRNRGHATPYKLVVLAPDPMDAVAAAGGLIVDSTRAGWQVDVFLEAGGDERALRILGVDSRVLPGAFDFGLEWPDAVVYDASTYDRHRGVRRLIADTVRKHRTEVACWGGGGSTSAGPAAEIEHRLSSAAQAFKRYALRALDTTEPASPVEAFRGGGVPPAVRR